MIIHYYLPSLPLLLIYHTNLAWVANLQWALRLKSDGCNGVVFILSILHLTVLLSASQWVTFSTAHCLRPQTQTPTHTAGAPDCPGGPTMEGVGSRLGRASSRYGPAATVFSGPVRKWKKRWVHVPQSYHSSHPQFNGGNSSRLVLCRWTPISSSTVTDSGSAGSAEEPPRRKFRYTPVSTYTVCMYYLGIYRVSGN